MLWNEVWQQVRWQTLIYYNDLIDSQRASAIFHLPDIFCTLKWTINQNNLIENYIIYKVNLLSHVRIYKFTISPNKTSYNKNKFWHNKTNLMNKNFNNFHIMKNLSECDLNTIKIKSQNLGTDSIWGIAYNISFKLKLSIQVLQ